MHHRSRRPEHLGSIGEKRTDSEGEASLLFLFQIFDVRSVDFSELYLGRGRISFILSKGALFVSYIPSHFFDCRGWRGDSIVSVYHLSCFVPGTSSLDVIPTLFYLNDFREENGGDGMGWEEI